MDSREGLKSRSGSHWRNRSPWLLLGILPALRGIYVYSGHPHLPPDHTGNSSGTGGWEAQGQAYSRCSEELVDFTKVWVAFEGQALYPGLSSLKSTWLFPMGWLTLVQLIKAPGTLTVS